MGPEQTREVRDWHEAELVARDDVELLFTHTVASYFLK